MERVEMGESQHSEFDLGYAAEQLRRAGHPLRRQIKSLYLRSVLRELDGPSADLGCGAGQMLERMPAGSIGVEVNPHLLAHLRSRGLSVVDAAGSADPFELAFLPAGVYRCLVLSHVLEHFEAADACLRRLLARCRALGISKVVLVVPGWAGFRSDRTHKTFVDRAYLAERDLLRCEGFSAASITYFPLNLEAAGRLTAYQEMKVVYVSSR